MKNLITTALMCVLGTTAFAEVECLPQKEMVNALEAYGETQQMVGTSSPAYLMQMFANTETGTWSAVVTTGNENGDMISCIVMHGENFYHTEVPPLVGETL